MSWLDKPVKSLSIHEYVSLTPDIKNYYLPSDYELTRKNEYSFLTLDDINSTVNVGFQCYHNLINKNKFLLVYIPSNTKRYELDILFRKLIDCCISNNFYDINIPLINPQLRESFYNFINNIK